jgi:uncharacterized phiE125 gp8 family phage protein
MTTVRVPNPAGEPGSEPVSLEEAKAQLRVLHDAEDNLIRRMITGAREYAETLTRLSLVPTVWERILDAFPCDGEIELLYPPIRGVLEVSHLNAAGERVVIAAEAYELDAEAEPGILRPTHGTRWPWGRAGRGAIRVRYRAGYGDELVIPTGIGNAILAHVALQFVNRDKAADFSAVDRALWPYRVDL